MWVDYCYELVGLPYRATARTVVVVFMKRKQPRPRSVAVRISGSKTSMFFDFPLKILATDSKNGGYIRFDRIELRYWFGKIRFDDRAIIQEAWEGEVLFVVFLVV